MVQHQLAHVLPGDPDDVGNLAQADEIRAGLYQPRIRNDPLDIAQGTEQGRLTAFGLATELQRQAPRQPGTDQRIGAAPAPRRSTSTSGSQSWAGSR